MRRSRIHWRELHVRIGQRVVPLERHELYAALYRWYTGDRSVEVTLGDAPNAAPITDPFAVNWTHFPTLEAMRTVARQLTLADELQRRSMASTKGPVPRTGPPSHPA